MWFEKIIKIPLHPPFPSSSFSPSFVKRAGEISGY